MTTLTLEGQTLIDGLLDEQAQLSAVETFARRHDADALPDQSRYYRDLLPATPPGEGQQYAFRVDLDACSGCKACVSACHSMNGLDEGESWRDVGQLVGVSGPTENPLDDMIASVAQQAVVQHVTTACHHCIDPGCLSGCPVKAYDKDPVTGIVRHLDDQCIGCQYCVFKCPYDVPKYSPSRGIVRKCDMCRERLSADEAPACVAACPTSAISITLVNVNDAANDAKAQRGALPGTPDPAYTQPTTQFVGTRPLGNARPADADTLTPEHAHWPLILMLPLTQLSVGALCLGVGLDTLFTDTFTPRGRLALAGAAALIGLTGLISSTLHLGRPLYAFRAVLGLRTSWLSREIVGFGGWFNTVLLYLSLLALAPDAFNGWLRLALGGAVVSSGLAAVFCSAMIYIDTPRALWARWQTLADFLLTSAALGGAATLLLTLWPGALPAGAVVPLVAIVTATSALRLLLDSRRAGDALAGTRQLLAGPLRGLHDTRVATGLLGGVLMPPIVALIARDPLAPPAALAAAAILCFAALTAGEIAARVLFFTSVVPPKMPGQAGLAAASGPHA